MSIYKGVFPGDTSLGTKFIVVNCNAKVSNQGEWGFMAKVPFITHIAHHNPLLVYKVGARRSPYPCSCTIACSMAT